jgi:hypothetical protein
MDVKEFRDSRKTQLADFETQYSALKTEYSRLVLAAIQEQDPKKQQELVTQVLSLNSEMSEQLRGILSALNKGSGSFDPKTLDELTQELITYQKQYSEIEQGKDRVNTLKLIHTSTKQKLSYAQNIYTFYLIALIVLCLLIVFLIIRSSWLEPILAIPSRIIGATGVV